LLSLSWKNKKKLRNLSVKDHKELFEMTGFK
jgi:hypothetical protein